MSWLWRKLKCAMGLHESRTEFSEPHGMFLIERCPHCPRVHRMTFSDRLHA